MSITDLIFMNRNRFQFHIKSSSQQLFTFIRGVVDVQDYAVLLCRNVDQYAG